MAAGQAVTVARDGTRLAWQPAGRPPVHLSPEARDLFVNANPRERTILDRDAAGRVTEVLVRNENSEIVYRRVP